MSSEESPRTDRPADSWDEPLRLTDPKAMRALAHPVRMALLDLLAVAGTLTATQASEALGESPANCAFHLRTLAKYGFVREAGGGRGRERPWTRTRRVISVSSTEQDNAQAAIAAGALGSVYFERWVERARRVFGSRERLPGWERATQMSRSAVFLTPEEAVEVEREIQEIIDRYRDRERDPSQRPAGALPVELAIFASPYSEYAGLKPAGESQDIS
jgi:DNA-binding transcriptional ArsR family regulator